MGSRSPAPRPPPMPAPRPGEPGGGDTEEGAEARLSLEAAFRSRWEKAYRVLCMAGSMPRPVAELPESRGTSDPRRLSAACVWPCGAYGPGQRVSGRRGGEGGAHTTSWYPTEMESSFGS